jgi:hypothetical protein
VRQHREGVYLIMRRATEEVLAVLRENVGVVGDHLARLFEDGGCGLDFVIAPLHKVTCIILKLNINFLHSPTPATPLDIRQRF